MSQEQDNAVYKNAGDLYFLSPTGTAIRLSINGYLIILSTTADPASPVAGQIWYRSDL